MNPASRDRKPSGATTASARPRATRSKAPKEGAEDDPRPEVLLYADGACSGNPGPGGWGVVLIHPTSGKRLELSGAEAETTNNRMELTAVIKGLERLKGPSRVSVVTDSRYLVDGMNGWIHTWQRNDWKTSDRKPVKNQDLWEGLLALSRRHRLVFQWIRGHAGHAENERCDRMAVEAIQTAMRLRKKRI